MMPTQIDAVQEWTVPAFLETMEIELEVICEDIEKNLFVISWKDTLGQSQGLNVIDRPMELHCTVRSDTALIAYYRGMSTSRSFIGFIAADSIVRLHFAPRPSLFRSKDIIQPFKNLKGIQHGEYKAIEVSLHQKGKQKILLEYDPNIMLMAWENPGALQVDPMQLSGPKFRKHMALDRYYLNIEDGKIKSGKKFLTKLGPKLMSINDLRIVDPHYSYQRKGLPSIKGQEFIKASKVDLELIDLKEFYPFEDAFPY